MFALANGHIGLRANLDEGEPYGLPGPISTRSTSCGRCRTPRPAIGYPESGQTIVNVTNGKIIRLLVDDEPFDVRYGELLAHERVLDLRAGVLRRPWSGCRRPATPSASARRASSRSPSGRSRPILYEVEPVDAPLRVVVQSELVANEPAPAPLGGPAGRGRARVAARSPRSSPIMPRGSCSCTRPGASGLLMAAGMDHVVDGPDGTQTASESAADVGRVTVAADLAAGTAPAASSSSSPTGGRASGRFRLCATSSSQRWPRHATPAGTACSPPSATYLDDFWDRADVELDGDTELQQAVRFALFHVLQAGARAEQRAIAAKGLTGPGYDGHTFWDTERFVLPVLTYTAPACGCRRAALAPFDAGPRPRARPPARPRGRSLPWRTIRGHECSGYWPAGTAAFHIGAGIADAVVRYQAAADDDAFERDVGLELLVETARLWRSLGHHDAQGRFRIDGVTGPDEYSAIADNNVYTNLMAQQNLRAAADAVARHPRHAAELGADLEEAAAWRDAARRHGDPLGRRARRASPVRGLHRATRSGTSPTPAADQYPLLLHFPYFELYRKQVVKQADLVLALHARGDAFSDEEKARDFAYYEALTVRDSSLSACTQAVIAAEVGHLELAYDYFGEAALVDLHDLGGNTHDGVHIASLAGAWMQPWPASAACATTSARSASRRASPPGSSASPSASSSAVAGSRSR